MTVEGKESRQIGLFGNDLRNFTEGVKIVKGVPSDGVQVENNLQVQEPAATRYLNWTCRPFSLRQSMTDRALEMVAGIVKTNRYA